MRIFHTDIQTVGETINDLRVRLAIGHYTISRGWASPAILRTIEDQPQAIIHHSTPRRVSYQGLDFYAMEAPSVNTTMTLVLTGGPDFAPPPRPSPVPPRPPTYQMAPNLSAGVPIQVSGTGRFVGTSWTLPTRSPVADFRPVDLLGEESSPLVIHAGARFVGRANGEIVEVVRVNEQQSEPVVHYTRVSDDLEATNFLFYRDFRSLYRPIDSNVKVKDTPVVDVLANEEWEQIDTGQVVVIQQVDTKRDLIVVLDKGRSRSVAMQDFVNKKYRKITRRTAYARLLEDD